MTDSCELFVSELNKIIEECQVFTFITRDNDLQKDACRKLEIALPQIHREKKLAIASGDENYANLLLGFECVASALLAEIKMWLLLKEGQPDQAWNELIAAQDGLLGASRAHRGFEGLDFYIRRLEAIEHLVFPPQVFMSSGMIVNSQTCSICEKEYEDCEHVKGRPYMGSFCNVILSDFRLDHVAIVDNPALKTCRVEKFSVEGGNRNRMTWRVEPTGDDNDHTLPPA
jgi:hypothetical protein